MQQEEIHPGRLFLSHLLLCPYLGLWTHELPFAHWFIWDQASPSRSCTHTGSCALGLDRGVVAGASHVQVEPTYRMPKRRRHQRQSLVERRQWCAQKLSGKFSE
uniref:Secreted protein n=1 Tax=Knipowitschia caucasica TaxID=637954 RepID=A0AAV2LNJ7_KNICA